MVEIQFQNLPQSDAIEAAVNRFATRLEATLCETMRCRVSLAADASRQVSGGPFFVHIEVDTPEEDLVADEASDIDVCVALLNAFHDMQTRVRAHVRN
ncbi:hypothetical protein LMG6871_01857 [Ralstonia edaphis]|uniref:HPF/RaiA family ribosome-associated protein n=1 Tax=Ralstonia edaphi TaxID=3058599 RepID=UPI0028F5962B|nr:HPF/RaiA family ribosome-associated protein [Ralstonia sp. LMG 6871]CAJ0716628.1 hypothetical protein LMG6871_01857 [Ralstonia sp. LMG 6871]